MSELTRNPSKVKHDAGMNPVAVISRNTTAFYLLDPQVYEALLAALAEKRATPVALANPAVQNVEKLINDNSMTFGNLLPKMLHNEQSRVNRGELAEKALRITHYRIEKFVLPFFKDMQIGNIQIDSLQAFVNLLNEEKLGGVSIGQYLVIVRKVLKYAHSMRFIDALPQFPTVEAKRTSRGGFTLTEYHQLLKMSWRMRGVSFKQRAHYINLRTEGIDEDYLVITSEMRWLIGFMVNSFVRPSDLRLMQHKHVEIVERENTYLRLSLPETKKHDKPIVTMRCAVGIYRRLQRDAKARGFGSPDDYVFLPQFTNRVYALRVMGFLFNWLMEEIDIKQGPHGIGRSLYSLRHTAITFRLLYGEGIDVLTLARNARTSVEMIERHYASTLNGEMNVDLIQSKRRRKPGKKDQLKLAL